MLFRARLIWPWWSISGYHLITFPTVLTAWEHVQITLQVWWGVNSIRHPTEIGLYIWIVSCRTLYLSYRALNPQDPEMACVLFRCVGASVCVCIYMYISIYVYTYIHVYMYICIYLYVYRASLVASSRGKPWTGWIGSVWVIGWCWSGNTAANALWAYVSFERFLYRTKGHSGRPREGWARWSEGVTRKSGMSNSACSTLDVLSSWNGIMVQLNVFIRCQIKHITVARFFQACNSFHCKVVAASSS